MQAGALRMPAAATLAIAGLIVLATTSHLGAFTGGQPQAAATSRSPSDLPAPTTARPAAEPSAKVTSRRLEVSAATPPVAGVTGTDPGGVPGTGVPPARVGHPAASQRLTFVPTTISLVRSGSGRTPDESAGVDPVDALQGDLSLPKDPGRVGWFVGGALPGEAFGGVVIAGHIDSRATGVGYFAGLLKMRRGDEVILGNGLLRQRYAVVSSSTVAKAGLRTKDDPFDQDVTARLVLITCTGRFDPVTRHYDENLVVVATPVGLASS